jgi:hypothetical protein
MRALRGGVAQDLSQSKPDLDASRTFHGGQIAMRDASHAKRPYSRLETDLELRSRISTLPISLTGELLDTYAESVNCPRRIIWVSP